MLKKILFLILFIIPTVLTRAQPQGFCDGIDQLVRAAPNSFKSVKDSVLKINERGIVWGCKVKIPGVIAGRIISIMGLRYEGAVFQSKNLDEVKQAYDTYKGYLDGCLLNRGYKLSYGDNFYKGLESYKKLVYISDKGGDTAPPPHISMETDFTKQTGMYTIVLYVWQH